MSLKVLTGNNCQACKDLKRTLDSLVEFDKEVEWVNIQNGGLVETDRPVRSVPTLINGNKVIATGQDAILEYLVSESN